MRAQKERQEELEKKNSQLRQEKNKSQARKLKVAYEQMLVFEQERQQEKHERRSVQEAAH